MANNKNIWNELPSIAKIAIIGGAGIGLFFLTRRIIKNFNKPPKFDLPQGGGGIPVVSYTPSGVPVQWNPQPLAAKLFDAMDGLFTFSGTKDAAFLQLGELPTNDMVVAVYNQFNQQYGNGATLTQWINDELWTDVGGTGKDLALQRLSSIGLP